MPPDNPKCLYNELPDIAPRRYVGLVPGACQWYRPVPAAAAAAGSLAKCLTSAAAAAATGASVDREFEK